MARRPGGASPIFRLGGRSKPYSLTRQMHCADTGCKPRSTDVVNHTCRILIQLQLDVRRLACMRVNLVSICIIRAGIRGAYLASAGEPVSVGPGIAEFHEAGK